MEGPFHDDERTHDGTIRHIWALRIITNQILWLCSLCSMVRQAGVIATIEHGNHSPSLPLLKQPIQGFDTLAYHCMIGLAPLRT